MSRKTLKKLRSKGLLTLVIAGIIGSMSYDAQAQQDPYFTHYMFNKLQYNPAAAGAKDGICIAGIFHTQWTGYEDQTFEYHNPTTGAQSVPTGLGPKTTGVSIDGKLLAISKKIDLGIGLAVAQDNLGYENNLKFRGAFSGIYNMTNGSSLALGIELGMLQKGVDGTNFIFKDLADPNIPATKVTKSNFNTAAGLYYVNPNVNDLYIGLSSTNINEQDFDYSNTTGSGFSANAGFIYKAHPNFRFGLAYQTPTWYTEMLQDSNFDRDSDIDIGETTFYQENQNFTESNNWQYIAYRLKTPSSLTASAALIFGKNGLLSVDYSTKNYKNQAQ